MYISTIIPTIGRPTLSRAVRSVLEQDFLREESEVIVVNDSGRELPVEDWQMLPNVRIVHINRLNRSIARNTGAAIATGRYFHFLDDDDWMLPGAFEAFWETTQASSSAWIHGAFKMVDNLGETIVDVYPDERGNCFINLLSWEWLPLQASIVEANAFFNVGGFVMLESLKGGFEDIHLSRQIAYQYNFMNVSKLVACIRSGDSESTTNYMDMFIQNRVSREKCLEMPRAYHRLIASARDNKSRQEYWQGKIVYYFLGSAVKNIRSKRFFTAISRLLHSILGIIMAARFLLKSAFWIGAVKPHFSRVWLAIKDSSKELYQNTRWNEDF